MAGEKRDVERSEDGDWLAFKAEDIRNVIAAAKELLPAAETAGKDAERLDWLDAATMEDIDGVLWRVYRKRVPFREAVDQAIEMEMRMKRKKEDR